ncbi:MAG: hypothetical protein ACOYX1_02195 [Acidobacteriota bacterium]
MLKRYALPAVLLLTAAACLAGSAVHGLLAQPMWPAEGWRRFLIFAGIYGAAAGFAILLHAPRAPLWLAAGAAVFTAVAAGPVAVVAVIWAIAGAWAAGWLLWPRAQDEVQTAFAMQVTLGLAAWASAVMWSAALPLHYRWLYWLLPGAAVAWAWQRGWRPRIQLPRLGSRSVAAAWCAGMLPLFAHWLVALKPEIGADGLAMHMVIPARMAAEHRWPFDPAEFAWALMPMGGDWVWTIGWMTGGEPGARLMNLLLLGLIACMVAERAAAALGPWPAAMLAGAFVSTPLVQHVTGSLFVENATALWLTAAALVLAGSRLESGRARLAFGLLAGMAAATKFGALAFLAPLAAGAVWLAGPRRAGKALAFALPVGLFPYANAWLRTGNPFFPFFNAAFRSPHFEAANFRDTRFETPPGWTTLYDLTFHSKRFIEGWDGAAGFLLFALVIVCVVAWRPRWPREWTVMLVVALAGGVISFLGQSNLRYLYPVLPLLVVAGAHALRESTGGRAAAAAVTAGFAILLLLHLRLLPAAGYYHGDFWTATWSEPERDAYLRGHAPERKLVEWLNQHAPHARVAWFDGNAIGDFRGRAFTATWHSPFFWKALREASDAAALERLMRGRRIDFVIAPAPEGGRPPRSVQERQFLESCMERVHEFGGVELRRWRPGGCREVEPPAAAPGVHDDTSASLRFRGAWIRDLQFSQAWRGTLVYTNKAGAEAVLRYEGIAARLMYTAAFNRCRAEVLLDGAPAGRFLQRSGETRWQQWSPWFEASVRGVHTLTLRIAPGSPTSCWIDLDAFEVR